MVASMTRCIQLAVCFAILFAVIANSVKFEDLEQGRGLKIEHDHEHEDKLGHAPEDEEGQCGEKNGCFDTTEMDGTETINSCECAELCNSDQDCHEWCWGEEGNLCYIAETHREIMELEGYYHGHQEAEEHEDHDHEDED